MSAQGIRSVVSSEQDDFQLGDVLVSMPSRVHRDMEQYESGKNTSTGFTMFIDRGKQAAEKGLKC